MSDDIFIDFELQYVQCNLADKHVECNPVLRVYYDAHFERSAKTGGIITLHLDENNLSKVYRGKLRARVVRGIELSLPETACIGLASYAERRNEFGMACYTNAGTAHVQVGEIVKARGGPFEKTLPLLMETTRLMGEPVEKGTVKFRVLGSSIGSSIRFIPVDECLLAAPTGTAKRETIGERVGNFIKRRIEFEASLEDTWPNIKNVRAPMDISSAGIELLGNCFVPIEGFALTEPIEVNVGYFQNAFERAMVRAGNKHPRRDFAQLDIPHKCEIMAELFTYAPQAFDYISDTVERSSRRMGRYDPRLKVGFEDFNDMGTTLSGDCEDGAKLAQLIGHGFLNLRINAKSHPELAELQRLASNYTFFLTLATVHGAKAEDNTEQIGAHMFGFLLPKSQVKRALQGTPQGRQEAARLPLDQPMGEKLPLPTLFTEGTGRIRPMGTGPLPKKWTVVPAAAGLVESHMRHAVARGLIGKSANHPMSFDPLFEERRYISMNLHSKGGLKTEIPHDVGSPSSFYLGNLLFVTSDFMNLGHNIGAFICGNQATPDAAPTRGALFTDIVNQKKHFTLIPCERMPNDIMAITREAVALRAPPLPFVFDPTQVDPKDTKCPLLETLKRGVEDFHRTGSSPYGSVDLFIRPHQMSEESIAIMLQEMRHMDKLYKVDYEKEYITNAVVTYRIRMFVDHEGK